MGSFRQLLLIGFMLIAALLGGTALRAVLILEKLTGQSEREAARAIELSGAVQGLSGRSTAMERAARQSLALNDSVLRRRFEEEAAGTDLALRQIESGGVPAADTGRWRARRDAIAALLDGPSDTALDRERAVAAEFRELDLQNGQVARRVQESIESRNRELRDRIETSRARLMEQVMATIALAVVLAIGLGVWLSRPFRRIERAIARLGAGGQDEPIRISGASDVRAIGRQLEWLRLRLVELDADKARFLRHVSHELKTPLAALREGVALLEEGVPGTLNAAQREVTNILGHNTLALQAQIEALLRFNAAAFEARQLRRQKIDAKELLQTQVDAQRLQWQAAGLAIQVTGAKVALDADPDKLGTAIGNLLSNAIRFSPRGGTITLAVSRSHGLARVEVCDEGPGIAEADRDRVFEPFYRGERQPPQAVRGSGVGLSIVQEYVTAHGGRVTLASDSVGTRFIVELPDASD